MIPVINRGADHLNIYDTHCRMTGDGDPVLILHPFLSGGFAQNPVVDQLSQQFRVYSITLPGMGPVLTDRPFTAEQHVEFLEKLVQTKYIEPFVLIGVSIGCHVALQYAVKNQDVRKLVLANPAGLRPIHPLLRISSLQKLFLNRLTVRLDNKDRFIHLFQDLLQTKTGRFTSYWPVEAFQKGSAWPGQAAQTIWSLGRSPADLKKRSERIGNPVLLIGGRGDRLISRSALIELEGVLQNVRLQWVEGGHLGIIENPEEYFIKIEQFL
jgi:pimeloyl-ACP methyl ester carboxylesterase